MPKLPFSPELKNTRKSDRKTSRNPWKVVILFIGMGLVGTGFWLARDPEIRTRLAERTTGIGSTLSEVAETVTQKVQNATESTRSWIDSVRTRLGSPPPPEIKSENATIPGAPPHISTPISTVEDLDRAIAEQGPGVEGGASERGAVASLDKPAPLPPDVGRKDDAVVRTDFVTDLAAWMVKGYTPSSRTGRSGSVSVSVQSGNLRYGAGMKGLAWIGEDISNGRSAALNHVFTPDMLNALYQLYINYFLDAVKKELGNPDESGKPLSPQQQKDFYQVYTTRFKAMAGVLQSIAAMPDFTRRMDDLKSATQKVVDTNAHYSELVFALDDAREKKESTSVDRLLKQVEEAGQLYRQSVLQREREHAAFAQSLRTNPVTQPLDEDTLLYISQWIERRVRNHPEKMNATLQSATLFLELANQFEKVSNTLGQ